MLRPQSLKNSSPLSTSHLLISLLLLIIATVCAGAGDGSVNGDPFMDDLRHPCHYLPPRPAKSNGTQVEANLLDLLNDGFAPGSDAILIMGSGGSKKSSLIKILTQDLSQLHVVLTQDKRPVIVDDRVRYNNSPPAMPNPLVPHLMKVDGMDNLISFYNCPSFMETFGDPEQDLAVNFFMSQLIRRIDRVKFLFLLPYDSTDSDLDHLVANATRFIKDFQHYSKSIGLIVTNVYSSESAIDIVENVAIFLTKYLDNLRLQSQSESDPGLVEQAKRKIQFVEPLLQQNQQQLYIHLNFARAPDICGPLNSSNSTLSTKRRLTQFYEELEYSQVNLTHFDHPLEMTNQDKLILKEFVLPVNQIIADHISVFISDYAGTYFQDHLQGVEPNRKLEALQVSTGILNETLSALMDVEELNPIDFANLIAPAIEKLGYDISEGFMNFMRLQQTYLEFDDQVNPPGIYRQVRFWATPVESWYENLLSVKREVEMEIELERKSMENKRLQDELNLLRGEFSGWRENEMNLLNEINDMLQEVVSE